MIDAIITTNNAYDTVLLKNGSALQLTPSAFHDLTSASLDIDNWSGREYWTDQAATITDAAPLYGQTIAQIIRGTLIVTDQKQFDARREFYRVNA